jgi:nucleoside-diphosphate-sugar epimerase
VATSGIQHAPASARSTLSVAVTGASGTLGSALLRRLDAAPAVERVVVVGRRETEAMRDSAKAEFMRVDVRDRAAVRMALAGADVVVHGAFALYGLGLGERALFDTNVRGKAQAELVAAQALRGSATESYVLRPCGIVGPHATGVAEQRVPDGLADTLRRAARGAARAGLRPLLPAPAVPLQFVHEDDVAEAIVLAVHGAGPTGTYNLAGEGWLDGDAALRALGLRPLPVPRAGIRAALGALGQVPPLVPALGWTELVREPVILDATRACTELGWRPRFSSREALAATRAAIGW